MNRKPIEAWTIVAVYLAMLTVAAWAIWESAT